MIAEDRTSYENAAKAQSQPWLVIATALAIAILIIGPRTSHAVYPLLAVLPAIALWRNRDLVVFSPPPAVAVAYLAFAGYLAVNAFWAQDPLEAAGKVGFVWLLFVVGYIAWLGLPYVSDGDLKSLSIGIVAGAAVGMLYLTIECVWNFPILKSVLTGFPALRPPQKHVKLGPDGSMNVGLYLLNRGFGAATVLLWPALMLLWLLAPRRRALWMGGLAVAGFTIATFSSEHETSMLALFFSAFAMAALLIRQKPALWLIMIAWLGATLLVVPIAASAYSAGLYKADWIPTTGRNRIILWGVTAQRIDNAPLLGIGVGSTKELDEQEGPRAERPADHTYPLRTGRHSHNVYMQAWYELGAIGAALLATLGITALFAFNRLPRNLRPAAISSFVAAAVMGAFSWGLFQTWFMAVFATWVIALMIAIELGRRTATHSPMS